HVSGGRRANRRSPVGSCTRIRVSVGVAVIVARMLCLTGWGAGTGRETDLGGDGQVFGTLVHHALALLAPFPAPFAVAVAMIGAAEVAFLVLAPSPTVGFCGRCLEARR